MIALLFDIDGTLLYSHGSGKRAFERAFLEIFGLSTLDVFPDAHGKTDPAIADEIAISLLGRELTDSELEVLNRRYLELLEAELAASEHFEILPGVAELLERLAAMPGILLGIQTGNLKKAAANKLARAKLEHHFVLGGYSCDSRDRAELVAAAITRAKDHAAAIGETIDSIFVIGDTVRDLEAAEAAGAKFIGVRTGRRSAELIGRVPAEVLLKDFTDQSLFLKLLLPA